MFRLKLMKRTVLILFLLLIPFISLTLSSSPAGKKVYEKGYLEERSGILVLHLKGSPYEMGYQHGMLTKHLIGKSQEVFDAAVPPIRGGRIGRWAVRRYFFWKLAKMEKYIPQEFIEELKGMADNITEREVNYREILLYHAMRDIGQVSARPVRSKTPEASASNKYWRTSNGACSGFVILPQATKKKDLIYGRNLDFLKEDSLENLVTFYEPDKGNAFVSIGWPGMMGVVSGMNDKGLTVGIFTAYSEDVSFDGIPSCFLMRKVLQYANSIEEAEEIIIQTKRTGPNIILVADKKKVLMIECSATKYALRKPQNGLLISSNHFLSPIYENDRKQKKALESGDSEKRYEKMEKLLKEKYGQIDIEYGIKILRDNIILKENTLHSVIFLPQALEFLIAPGPGARGNFVKFELKNSRIVK
jgi:predicted choloylglycine hydrolase